MFLRTVVGQERLLRHPAGMPQGDRLPRIELHSLFAEQAGDVMRQRQVHVVAADQEMIADGDALKLQLAA